MNFRFRCGFGGVRIGCTFVWAVILGIPLAIYILLPMINVTQITMNNGPGISKTKKDAAKEVEIKSNNPFGGKWQIRKNGIPNIVHVMWCHENASDSSFTFKNYLSVKSAVFTFQPDIINFHFVKELPQIDEFRYNTWLDDLQESVHNFILVKDDTVSIYCQKSRLSIYADSSGIYLDANIIATPTMLVKQVAFEKDNFSSETFICSQFTADVQSLPICFSLKDNEILYPGEFFEPQTQFARFTRNVVYGNLNPLIPQKNPQSLIPLICHYIWLGGGTLEFLLYLSILSCLHVVKADSVLVHGDEEPRGPLWKELIERYPGRLVYIYRPQQKTVFGRPVTKLSPMSDVLRMDILLKYGGIYTDWDAIWVKPLDAELREYDTVISFDWPAHLKPYPDTLNLGVMVTKPNAPYLRHLQESLHDYVDGIGPTLWCYICLKAYKVYERYPATVRLDRRLQVIAYNGFYHPSWADGYKEIQFKPPSDVFDWRRGDTYALHWTFPTPLELRAVKFLRTSNTTAADVARYILQVSGINKL